MIFTDPTLGDIRIDKVTRNLNGETGEPYHAVSFKSEAGDLIGIVFEADKHVAIIDPAFPSLRYRGDDFEMILRLAIDAWAVEHG
jgi:hypothetical protein